MAEAQTDSTQLDDSVATDSQTEASLLDNIMRNTSFLDAESLPEQEEVPQIDTEESDEEVPEASEEDDTEEVEEEVEDEEDDTADEDADDESATQEAEVYSTDDLDLEAKVVVKIDGEDTEVSFGDLIKGYSTEQHLSKKGRELGDARQEMEQEYQQKLEQIESITQASAAVLYSDEQKFAKEYHDLEAKIEKAREEGDNYELSELKDKREQVQKNYWTSRNNREALMKQVEQNVQKQSEQMWQEQIDYFNETIPSLIPDFNQDTAQSIRQFALDEGISPEVLDAIADPMIVKFVDDYRRLKQGVSKGAAKRKTVVAKKAPLKKSKPAAKKKQAASERTRDRVLSGNADESEQMDFLRGLAERSLNL